MKFIEKNLIIGVIKSATKKASKFFEKGKLLSDEQFQEILEECNTYQHLFFYVLKIEIIFGNQLRGKPRVTITLKAEEYVFKSSFILRKPLGKFNDKTPFAQEFEVVEIEQDK